MNRLFDVIKWGLTLGKEPQTFLGAKWIEAFLKRVSKSKKRIWALRILSLSPHYFIDPDNPNYAGMKNDEYLEVHSELLTKSREDIYQKILSSFLKKDFYVLDYGCGPGYLAKATAPHVKKIYAIDISNGAISCAKIVNFAENIEYIVADGEGLNAIPDEGVDAIYSFAVVQHVTDEIFESILDTCRKKLKPGGLLLLHIQLTDEIWKTEKQFKEDKSIKGKIKYQYALHCFGRSEQEYAGLISKHDFVDMKIKKIEDFGYTGFDEHRSQRLLVARRNPCTKSQKV